VSDRRSRFEKLERPRAAGPEGEGRPAAADRFGDVGAGEASAGRGGASASVGDRFRDPAARPPEVAASDLDEQPFIRCRRCETDNSRYGRRCTTCGEDLHGPEQRAFNEALWAERKRQRAEEERLGAERQAEQARADAELAAARRAAAEEMAREVGRRERARLESGEDVWGRGSGDPWGGGYGMGDPSERSSIAVRLLRRIRDPRWRMAAVASYLGLLVLLVALARVNRLFLVAAMILVALALPPSAWRWRRRRWWW